MRKCSRRGFAGFLLAALFRPLRLKGQSTVAAPTASPRSPGESAADASSRTTSRTYRADAVILFLGISIYRRAGVGGGHASLEETGEGASLRRTLFFAGGSDPKRAHGLNRLGWMREVVVGPTSAPSEAAYFGVLTSSPEESLEHARKSVAAPPSGRSIFSAASGRNTAGHSRSAVTHFEFAAGTLWSDPGLIGRAQSTFHENVDWRETAWPKSPNQAPPTFLYQMAALLKPRTRRAVGRYVYNEQEYLLELEGPPTGGDRERLLPFRGKIRNLRTGHETVFRLWLEEASDSIVPVRIEFQPRSFLRLTFEALPA
ncbi:MAG TPA: hypothetical protein VKJ01_18900 [Candidatus Solibacter sp.]|nr:hypothetical protein [Candidatus Solibacter sp.]